MRVLTVGNMYPPHHYGGYELVWRSTVEHLRARGHEVRVLTTDTDTGAREPDGPDVHRELRWRLRDAEFEKASRRVRVSEARHNHRVLDRHMDEFKPDAVAWWAMGGLTLTLLESVRRREIPAVAFVLDDWLDYGQWADPWMHMLRGRKSHAVRAIAALARIPAEVDFDGAASYVFCSDRTKQHAFGHGHRLGRTSVANLGIHTDYLHPEPPPDWGWRLLYVGRLDPRKGVDTAIEALPHLPEEARLELIGGWDTREEDRLRALARELGVEARVGFGGHRDRPEILRAYADCDAVVFPVRWEEPWGLVPLEAMGKGRPVVATGRGGSGEYLRDAENCLLFDAGDAESLAGALGRLASDPELRRRLYDGGLETAARYTEPLYNEAVEKALLAAASVR
ncbi:MAG: glycosyltransferase family 4 protein [Thermoleophilaceae bacterium]